MEEIYNAKSRRGHYYQFRLANQGNVPPVIMLHGWQGNEKAMWILTSALPAGGFVASVRGFHTLGPEKYGWLGSKPHYRPHMQDFQTDMAKLEDLVQEIALENGSRLEDVALLGFSQGAAAALAAGNHFVQSPAMIIAIAAFLPLGDILGLRQTDIFWGHGSEDPIVPIEIARAGVQRLQVSGCRVSFCEAHTGHKLALDCVRGLKRWMQAK